MKKMFPAAHVVVVVVVAAVLPVPVDAVVAAVLPTIPIQASYAHEK